MTAAAAAVVLTELLKMIDTDQYGAQTTTSKDESELQFNSCSLKSSVSCSNIC